MDKKRVCFIAQFPPPMHGLSKAVETLYGSVLADEFAFEKVNLTQNAKFLPNLCRIARSKADLFYFTISQTRGGNLRDLLILKVLQMQNKRCVVHLHGGYYRELIEKELPGWQKRANYAAVGRLEGAIVLGNSLRGIFKGILPDHKIFVVPNCVDDAYVMEEKQFEQKTEALEKNRLIHVLYLSNFIRTKGYFEVLELAKQEKERCELGGRRRLHFDFAGGFFEKTEETAFFNYIKENALDEYISYHGIVVGDEKRRLLEQCEVFVLLTRYPKEGQPISILEAMGNGMMVVTTHHAGIADIVKEPENGIVVDKADLNIRQCYQALLEKTENTEEMKKILLNNRNCVVAEYNQTAYVERMRTILRRC